MRGVCRIYNGRLEEKSAGGGRGSGRGLQHKARNLPLQICLHIYMSFNIIMDVALVLQQAHLFDEQPVPRGPTVLGRVSDYECGRVVYGGGTICAMRGLHVRRWSYTEVHEYLI